MQLLVWNELTHVEAQSRVYSVGGVAQSFMESSGDNGVLLVSLGTISELGK